MKSFRLLAAICAVVLSAGASKALDLDFFFRGGPGDPIGTVSGEIDGLPNNGGGSASAVFLNSWPSAIGKVCSAPCNVMASPWHVLVNTITVSNGQVVDGQFSSSNPTTGSELDLFVGHSGPADIAGPNNSVVGNVVFGPCRRLALICSQIGAVRRCQRVFRPCP
jgi:hypothetical protein